MNMDNENLERFVRERTEELMQVNNALRKERRRFEHLLGYSPAITYTTTPDAIHACNYVSENLREISGYSPEEMTSDPDFWINHVHPDDRQGILHEIERNLQRDGGSVQYRFLHSDGTYRWIYDQHRVIRQDKTPIEIIGSWTDITEQRQLKEVLDYKSSHDELTGLINRKEFEILLQQLLDKMRSDANEHVLCYMDLDQFKVINDTYGHVAGDELLRQLSKELQSRLRRRDILARLGGDEFGILLKYCALQEAQRVLNIIQEAIHEFRFLWDGKHFVITASTGVVPINRNSGNPDNILGLADSACYAAKEAGRDRIHIYTESDESLGQRRQEMLWVERINRALEEDRFYLYYQPIVAINDNIQHEHYELLIRMMDEEGDLVPPGAFLPAAERYNLSTKIDRWVIQTTFSWLEAYSELLEFRCSWGLNLSGQSLADEGLLEFVIKDLARKKIPAEKIYFEITETAAIANLKNATRFISAMKDHGCRFALDDFGSGLSSFAYLKNLPVDYLKIDGAFVKNIVNDNTDFVMVKAINDIGHALGKTTIAEFAENNDIIMKLKHVGVDYAQGYGICKPHSLTEFTDIMRLPTVLPGVA
ncbi:MAG: EAL domain-containing protein [Gammaproteobacteria bacterium]